jgi:hypothetical protein
MGKCDIRSCDLEITDVIDCKTPVGYFSFRLCPIHYHIFTEAKIIGRNPNPKNITLSKMANWRDESWQP